MGHGSGTTGRPGLGSRSQIHFTRFESSELMFALLSRALCVPSGVHLASDLARIACVLDLLGTWQFSKLGSLLWSVCKSAVLYSGPKRDPNVEN